MIAIRNEKSSPHAGSAIGENKDALPVCHDSCKASVGFCARSNRASPFNQTTNTEFWPPNGFGANSLEFGSAIHWPSTTIIYS